MKYFSYGMNTNLSSMAMRCPKAVSLGAAILPHYEFEFKSFATVTPKMDSEAHGVLWDITPDCEIALDRLEGYPVYYNKINVMVMHNDIWTPAMTYLMYPEEELQNPSRSYLDTLAEGYTSHGIELTQLNAALDRVHYANVLTTRANDSKLHTYNY